MGFLALGPEVTEKLIEEHGSLDAWLEHVLEGGADKIPLSFPDLMERYRQEGTVFQSPVQSALYHVSSVDSGGCSVERLTANEPERVTFNLLDEKLKLVQQNEGEYPFAELSGTAAIRTTLLQALQFGLSPDKKKVLYLGSPKDALEHLCLLIGHLGVDRSAPEPKLYKPAMLACVLEGLLAGELKENRIQFDWILPRFLEKMTWLGQDAGPPQAAYAYCYLASDLFWMLCYNYPRDRVPEPPSPSSVREKVRHAIMKDTYWMAIQDEVSQKKVLDALAEHWWPDRQDDQRPASAFWWVNQGATYNQERSGGYIWAPQKNEKGRSFHHWTNVSRVEPGNIVFHYANGQMRAISIARSNGYESERPAAISSETWQKAGWRVDLAYHDLSQPIPLAALNQELLALKMKNGPINSSGGVNQGYLFGLSDDAVKTIVKHINIDELPSEMQNPLRSLHDLPVPPISRDQLLRQLIEDIEGCGFIFHPWQVAAYVTALRTKPFVILAGVSGTGKSKLPSLVAGATTGSIQRISVRPDWTDSSDVLGYVDLEGKFRPARVLQLAKSASGAATLYHVCLIDEMNLARVEHYFAEILSCIEDRSLCQGGGYESSALVVQTLSDQDVGWSRQGLPRNLAIVGTVNMDESTHGFSRKVLDRAFTIEFSDIHLSRVVYCERINPGLF